MQIFFSLLVLNVMYDLDLFLKNENCFGMQLFKSGNHAANGAIFIPLLYVLGGPSSVLKKSIFFLEIVYFLVFGEQRSCAWRGARSASFGVLMSPKRRLCAAHGRARGQTPLVVSERLLLRYEQFILLRHFNSLRGIPFRSELRNWLFRGTRNASE